MLKLVITFHHTRHLKNKYQRFEEAFLLKTSNNNNNNDDVFNKLIKTTMHIRKCLSE